MIGRIWHGWTTPEYADKYQELLKVEVLPGISTRTEGYEGVILMRREDGEMVEFVTLTLWESMDAVKTLVGENFEEAYVPPAAREVLDHFDETSVHYEVILESRQAQTA